MNETNTVSAFEVVRRCLVMRVYSLLTYLLYSHCLMSQSRYIRVSETCFESTEFSVVVSDKLLASANERSVAAC